MIPGVTADVDEVPRDVHVAKSITIDRAPEELYSFWRDFDNLPHFIRDLESITPQRRHVNLDDPELV